MRTRGRRDGERGAVRLLAVGLGLIVLLQVVLGAVVATTYSWAEGLEREQTLLPGTHVAGVDVGGLSVAEARQAVDERAAVRLDEPIVVTAEDARWRVTPRELGAEVASREAVEAALAEGASAGWWELASVRWFGGDLDVDATSAVDPDRVDAVVGELAQEFDREPRDAAFQWSTQGIDLRGHRQGRRLYQGGLAADLAEAVRAGEREVTAEVNRAPVAVTTDQLEPYVEEADGLVDQSLRHQVTVTAEQRQWTVTPTDVGAEPDLEALRQAAVDADAGGLADGTRQGGPLTIPDEGVRAMVEQWAGELDIAPQNAQLNSSGGRLEFEPHQTGRAVERESAAAELDEALRGQTDRVALSLEPVEPDTTLDDYQHVLLLRQEERKLYHYVNQQVQAEWDVAVGAGGSPTPTGQFVVGAKRHRPTWYNPDPSGWGSNMPEIVEPGASNPLGLRALNWNQNGADTLIRFHGTAVESSIGRAASKGCVRLTNSDVVELYDRVPQGTAIVSTTA